ncbi:Neuromedin-U receptor 2 [Holothuria leucospilota]|uniref:Neuromedin-U receptor 2 n=1 Tax=Holothuria leucospilota TaxID=206669 RepID=A0A9Q1C373_HOLLE|nr:Neuromedin-U receptor 2 [Holothuria leucospilota]
MEFPSSSYLLGDYSLSYFDYVSNDECTGFGWNFLNSTDDKIHSFLNPQLRRINLLYLQPLVAVVGALANLAFIFIVCKVPYMRNRMNVILLNLSIADLIYLMVGAGEKFVTILRSPVWGDSLVLGQICQCFIIIPLLNTVVFTSLLLVSMVSLERYVAVCRPLQHLKIASLRRTVAYVISVWVFCIALSVFLIPSSMDFSTVCVRWPDTPLYTGFPVKVGFCQARSDLWSSVNESLQTIPFFVALMLNVVCTVKIVSKLYGRSGFPSAPDGHRQHRQTVRKYTSSANAATKMLLINGIAYFLLVTPFHVTKIIQFIISVSPNSSCNCLEFKEMSGLLLYLNSAVNPFIYGVTNRTYRQAYYNIFCHGKFKTREGQNACITTVWNLTHIRRPAI